MLIVLIKPFITPLLIGLSLFAARRWGAFIGGVLAGLPSISGVASFFLALEQGPAFAADAAAHSLYGVVVCCAMTLVYVWLAKISPWYIALPCALVVYWGAGLAAQQLPNILWISALAAIFSPPLVILLLPRPIHTGILLPRPPWVIPAQMVCAGLLIVLLTEGAASFGAYWSGVLLFFPVCVIVLGTFAHAVQGLDAVIPLVRGLMTGFVGGVLFSVFIAYYVCSLPLSVCYALATGIALGTSALISMGLSRRRQCSA